MPTRFKISHPKVTVEPKSGFEPRPDFGQMVVVVFSHEIEMVGEAERLLQARVQESSKKDSLIEFFHFFCLFHKGRASDSKVT
jgi:hypothetical protein